MLKDEIIRIFSELSSRLLSNNDECAIDTPQIQLTDEIKKAYQDWVRAQKYFQWVCDPELVDHAIFQEEAARKKYIYLLNKAKNQGISIEWNK
ncbi:MAG: DUF2508 family protein [Tepidanaerobacteraceae bacterium]|nr:DUF2508 family protein [Thermoanaerobacterales bacterium]